MSDAPATAFTLVAHRPTTSGPWVILPQAPIGDIAKAFDWLLSQTVALSASSSTTMVYQESHPCCVEGCRRTIPYMWHGNLKLALSYCPTHGTLVSRKSED